MLQQILLSIIKVYGYTFSIFCGGCCRFYPSCSAYAIDAINKFGVMRGMWLTCKRIFRCNPWCKGGHDPVP